MDHYKKPDTQLISDLVRRIVDEVHPLRIVLFGSAATGKMGDNSDLDILVIMPDGTHRRRTAQAIYRSLQGLGFAKDIIVATANDVHEHGGNPSLVLYQALTQGKELYRAA